MTRADRPVVKAVLGPTNTGKTHLAIERLCAHSSGIIGFPLRLLAREVYDRVVAIKGAAEVGLITGEERIMPPGARWLLCTAESMPIDRDVAFVALDEAQLGIDPERGHVFTDRLLHARGRDETMILGSDALRPVIRALVPGAEIIARPRFSDLRHAGPVKLSRLPPRSAVVAFSAEQVYAVAEMLRRQRGGAAVVMGALSPRTRNAQVAMFQAGEVDYLVATDAIGMGLNMDVAHIAFASLSKFDGRRQRRLTIAEMAQIAGRAGRHQRDGTFGALSGLGEAVAFSDDEVDRIENHRFPPLDHLLWRNSDLSFRSMDALLTSLEQLPGHPMLRPAPDSIDLVMLRLIAAHPGLRERLGGRDQVAMLWDLCGLPDFRKVGAEHHVHLIIQLFEQRLAHRHIQADWFAKELARLDNVSGDVDRIASRLAGVRTLAYIAQRHDWLAEPGEWAVRTMALEERLSDALHQRLTERFVDRRTAVLMRAIGRDPALLQVAVDDDDRVTVDGQPIGQLEGFRFVVGAQARLADRKLLLAAADHHLPRELARRADALVAAPDAAFAMQLDPGHPVRLLWRRHPVAMLHAAGAAGGGDLLKPTVRLDPALGKLPPAIQQRVRDRLQRWIDREIGQRLGPLRRMAALADDARTAPPLRALLANMVAGGGMAGRDAVEEPLAALDPPARHRLRQLGVVIGALDLYHPQLLKPGAVALFQGLRAAKVGRPMPALPMPGLGLLDQPSDALAAIATHCGYRGFGDQMLRIDLVQRVAEAIHAARGDGKTFEPERALATSIGIGTATLERIWRALGFQPVGDPAAGQWRWRGRPRRQGRDRPDNPAFAALAALRDATPRHTPPPRRRSR